MKRTVSDKKKNNIDKKDINVVLSMIISGQYDSAKKEIKSKFEDNYNESQLDINSISMSLSAYIMAMNNEVPYKNILKIMQESAELVRISKSIPAEIIKEFVLGELYYKNDDLFVALCHYNNAINLCSETDLGIQEHIVLRIRQIKENQQFILTPTNDPLLSLVKIGRSITAQTDIDKLLKVIAEETKNALQADRCTVFLLDKEKNELWSKTALGLGSHEIRFPVDKGLAGYTVRTGESINIKDAYNDNRFNPDVDKSTGYKTKTILCMPIKNNNQEIIGAFQVLNKVNGTFNKNDENLLIAIGGSASIALENAQLFEEQKLLLNSFIDTLASSIDARDKITAGHSTRVKLYAMLIAEALHLNDKARSILEKAATLHDIGKIGIRDSVLQKEGKLTDEEYKHIQEHVKITHNILENFGFNEDFKEIDDIACSHHEKYDGTGYYRRLKGEEIPLGGRILAVADVFDAITSKRHYRDKMPIINVIDILINGKNTHFDKNLIDVFMEIPLNKIINVFLTENHNKLTAKDDKILGKYSLKYLYEVSTQKVKNKDDEGVLNLFNNYYSGAQDLN